MTYRLQLDTKKQLFIAIDVRNQKNVGTGATVEEAVAALKS
ncbi:hypothetical protein [Lacticaseibacillus zhaodongensis]|nr:hypothetical protein [Lacticaseibacillus zhaodongensis]